MEWLLGLTPVDYVIISVLLVALAIGWAQGLVEVLTGFLVFIVATFVAGRYSGMVGMWLNRGWNAQDKLAAIIERRITLPSEAYKVPASAIPWEKSLDWLNGIPVPAAYREALAQRISDWSQTAGNQTAAEFIIQQLAAGVMSAVVFVVLTMVVSWLLALLARLISDQIKEIPLVGTVNRLLGSVAVSFQAAVIVALLIGLVVPVVSMYWAPRLGSAVEHAQLTPSFLIFFDWLRRIFFGVGSGSFFAF